MRRSVPSTWDEQQAATQQSSTVYCNRPRLCVLLDFNASSSSLRLDQQQATNPRNHAKMTCLASRRAMPWPWACLYVGWDFSAALLRPLNVLCIEMKCTTYTCWMASHGKLCSRDLLPCTPSTSSPPSRTCYLSCGIVPFSRNYYYFYGCSFVSPGLTSPATLRDNKRPQEQWFIFFLRCLLSSSCRYLLVLHLFHSRYNIVIKTILQTRIKSCCPPMAPSSTSIPTYYYQPYRSTVGIYSHTQSHLISARFIPPTILWSRSLIDHLESCCWGSWAAILSSSVDSAAGLHTLKLKNIQHNRALRSRDS